MTNTDAPATRYVAQPLPNGSWFIYDTQTDSVVENRTDRDERGATLDAAALNLGWTTQR